MAKKNVNRGITKQNFSGQFLNQKREGKELIANKHAVGDKQVSIKPITPTDNSFSLSIDQETYRQLIN